MIIEKDLLTTKEASKWASDYLRENVTISNISLPYSVWTNKEDWD